MHFFTPESQLDRPSFNWLIYTEISLKPTLLSVERFGFDKLSQRRLSLSKAIYAGKGKGALAKKLRFHSVFCIVKNYIEFQLVLSPQLELGLYKSILVTKHTITSTCVGKQRCQRSRSCVP